MDKEIYASENNIPFIIFDSLSLNIIYINEPFLKVLEFDSKEDLHNFSNDDFSLFLDFIDNSFNFQETSTLNLNLKTRNKLLKNINVYFKKVNINNNDLIYLYIKENNDFITYDFSYNEGDMSLTRFLEYVNRLNYVNTKYDFDKYVLIYLTLNHESLAQTQNNVNVTNEIILDLKNIFDTEIITQTSDSSFLIYAKDLTIYAKIYRLNEEINKCIGFNTHNFKAGVYKIECLEPICDMVEFAHKTCNNILNNDNLIYKYYNDDIILDQKIYEYVKNNIDKAIDENEIEVYYQPVIRTINNTLCSAEALARWKTSEFGLLSPYSFIKTLEDTKQIDKLDTYVFELICKELRHRLDNNLEYVPISFNLSRLDFILMDPFQMVLRLTNKYDIPHRLIKIEITESVVMSNPEEMKNVISKFKNENFDIWMDDFGSAYSSLNMLKEFDLDEIKLDMEFVKILNDKSKIIIKNVIAMSKDLGIQTLCEGVETKEQFLFLKSIGCEKTQGYLFSKPVPFSEMIKTIKDKKIEIEKPLFRDYFSKLSRVNFQTDLPICILNLANKEIQVYYLNDACKKNLAVASLDNEIVFEKTINSLNLKLKQKICNLDSNSNFIQVINGHLFKISSSLLKNCENNYLYLLNIELINVQDENSISKFNTSLREISQIFTSVIYLDFKNNSYDIVLTDNNYLNNKTGSLSESLELIKKHVYVSDLNRFEEFFVSTNLALLFSQDNNREVSQTFRVYNKRKEIVRIKVGVILISKIDSKYLIFTRDLTSDEEIKYNQISKMLSAKEDLINISNGGISSYDMFISIIKNTKEMYYFKDSDHKFLGGSDKFLEFIGINHVSKMIGFKDIELGLTVSNNKLYRLESDVIKNKVEIKNETINFIKNGKMVQVKLNIYPICENQNAKGIFAEIIDTNICQNINNQEYLNFNMLLDAYLKYNDQYKYYNEPFVTYKIDLYKLDEIKNTLGVDFVKKVEDKILNVLIDKYGKISTIARIGYAMIGLIKHINSDNEIDSFKEELRETIFNIKSINGINITLFNKIEFFKCTNIIDENIKSILNIKEVNNE